jgi:hypothetical protein
MLMAPTQLPPKLAAYKEFNHWSSAMKAYLIGGGFWPYVVEMGYGEVPVDPGPGGDRRQYQVSLFHREMNTTVGKELLFQALGEDASAGFREEPTLKAVWDKVHEERLKGDSRKLAEAVHIYTHLPFEDGKELAWFGKMEEAQTKLFKCLGIHNCQECKGAGRVEKLEELFGALALFKLPDEKYRLQKYHLQRGEEKELKLSNIKREVLLSLSDAGTQSTIKGGKETGSTPSLALVAGAPRYGGKGDKGGPGKGDKKETKPDVPVCEFCGRTGHLEVKCWNKKQAEYYKTHGSSKYYDPRKAASAGKAEAKVAKRVAKADAEVDIEYDAMLSETIESGKCFSSEYPRASLKNQVKELRRAGCITAKLAKRILALTADELKPHSLIIDTGAVLHLLGHKESFQTLHTLKDPIAISGFGEDMTSCATGVGTVTIRPKSKGAMKRTITLERVFYVPKMPFGLLSVAVLLDAGYEFLV